MPCHYSGRRLGPCRLSAAVFVCVILLCYTTLALALQSSCPATCSCTVSGDYFVFCGSGVWTEVPPLPYNTTKLKIQNSNFTILRGDSFPAANNILSKISLLHLEIRSVHENAFYGVRNLSSLNMRDNELESLPELLFLNSGLLRYIILKGNKFKTIPHESLCMARSIQNINLAQNELAGLYIDTCFRELSRLRILDFSDNPLRALNSSDFRHLQDIRLKDLRIANCGIEVLSEDIFTYTRNLSSIQLGDNDIDFIPSRIFEELPFLQNVFLVGNRLQVFEPIWLPVTVHTLNMKDNEISTLTTSRNIQLGGIQSLYLDENPVIQLHDYTFATYGLYNIETLSIQRCHLRRIARNTFANLTSLRILSISFNPITPIALGNALHGLSESPLEILKINSIKVREVSNRTFSALNRDNLTRFSFEHNGLRVLENGVFNHFKALKVLSLRNNALNHLESGCFSALVELEHLLLSGNELLSCVSPGLLGLSLTLTRIMLKHNRIGRIQRSCMEGIDNVREYSLADNAIEKIHRQTFSYRQSISYLSLCNNKITALHNNTFNNMTSLQKLDFTRNRIEHIEAGCFLGLLSLQELLLSQNPFLDRQLNNLVTAFRDLCSLEILEMENCGLKTIPNMESLQSLYELDLSSNSIVSWEADLFINQRKLRILRLSQNRVVTLSSRAFQFLPSLEEVYLQGNPFTCTCDLSWFVDWIQSGNIFSNVDVRNKNVYSCASPPELKYVSLFDVDTSYSVCGPKETVIAASVGGLIIILILLTGGLLYHYRWYVRYAYFLLQRRIRQQRAQDNPVEHMFDAFVSYNHGDQRWVIERLLPALEYRGGLKLCLHDRDWLAGCAIADNILESIEHSNKTVLILSNSFAQSEWCQLELHMAQHKLLTSKRDMLVLVMLEEIEACHMSRSLRHIVTSQTYLTWHEDDQKKQRRFWEGLIKSIKAENWDI